MRAAHAMASSREGSSNTVKPPSSVGRPRIAAHRNRAVSRDEYGQYVFVDSTAEDVDAGGFRLINHGVCVATQRNDDRRARASTSINKLKVEQVTL